MVHECNGFETNRSGANNISLSVSIVYGVIVLTNIVLNLAAYLVHWYACNIATFKMYK